VSLRYSALSSNAEAILYGYAVRDFEALGIDEDKCLASSCEVTGLLLHGGPWVMSRRHWDFQCIPMEARVLQVDADGLD
jgi:hypothetical protein